MPPSFSTYMISILSWQNMGGLYRWQLALLPGINKRNKGQNILCQQRTLFVRRKLLFGAKLLASLLSPTSGWLEKIVNIMSTNTRQCSSLCSNLNISECNCQETHFLIARLSVCWFVSFGSCINNSVVEEINNHIRELRHCKTPLVLILGVLLYFWYYSPFGGKQNNTMI